LRSLSRSAKHVGGRDVRCCESPCVSRRASRTGRISTYLRSSAARRSPTRRPEVGRTVVLVRVRQRARRYADPRERRASSDRAASKRRQHCLPGEEQVARSRGPICQAGGRAGSGWTGPGQGASRTQGSRVRWALTVPSLQCAGRSPGYGQPARTGLRG
jgi:hypothetical protein